MIVENKNVFFPRRVVSRRFIKSCRRNPKRYDTHRVFYFSERIRVSRVKRITPYTLYTHIYIYTYIYRYDGSDEAPRRFCKSKSFNATSILFAPDVRADNIIYNNIIIVLCDIIIIESFAGDILAR